MLFQYPLNLRESCCNFEDPGVGTGRFKSELSACALWLNVGDMADKIGGFVACGRFDDNIVGVQENVDVISDELQGREKYVWLLSVWL